MVGRDITFNFPQASFLILALIPLLLAQIALVFHRKRQQSLYTSASLLPKLMMSRSSILNWTKAANWAIIWILLCFALMEPFGNIRYTSSTNPHTSQAGALPIQHEVIFLADTSASMRVEDGPNGLTRLEASKAIMEDILRQLRGQTVSLYAFTSQLSAVVPATLDYIFTRLSINELKIDQGDVGGTRFAQVLTSLKEQAFPEPSTKKYTVIMLTDGGDTELERLRGSAREEEVKAILNAISIPEQLHLRLFTVGIGKQKAQPIPHVTFEGKPVYSQLEPDILQELAARERGKYYMADAWTSWDLALELAAQMEANDATDLKKAQAERKVAEIQKEDVIVDLFYQIPLGLALLFILINFMLPDVRK